MFIRIWNYYLENIKMKNYKESYNELKKNINSDNSNIISYLFLGILIGRVYEKYRKIKKITFKRLF